jgi:hypothetical protein
VNAPAALLHRGRAIPSRQLMRDAMQIHIFKGTCRLFAFATDDVAGNPPARSAR